MNLLNEIKHTFSSNDNAIRRIIIINIAVFLTFAIINAISYLLTIDSTLIGGFKRYLMLPASFSVFIRQPWSILTCMFLHDGFIHILFNMLWLFWIGSLMHEYLGNRKVYEAYFAGGIFGGFIYMLAYHVFPVFSESINGSYALGASAGVLSIVMATATLLPDYPIQLLLFGTVRLKYIALVSVLLDLISIPQGNAGGHIAHIGGALFGFLYIKYIYKYGNLVPDKVLKWFERKPKLKVHYRTTYQRAESDPKPSQEDIDMILDKINKSGYDSLSKKEKEILFKASKD